MLLIIPGMNNKNEQEPHTPPMKVPTEPNMTSKEVKVIMTHLYMRCKMINGDVKLQRGALALAARNFEKSRYSIRNVWQRANLFFEERGFLTATLTKLARPIGSNDKKDNSKY